MKNTNWNIIQSGQLVKFRYKNMKGVSSNRTAYVLAPRYRYRKQSTGRIVEFFIGLEIENSDKGSLNPIVVKELFEQINDIFEDSEKSADYTEEATMKRIYGSLQRYLDKTPIFRTYFLRECRKKRVFLIEEGKDLGSSPLTKVIDLIISDKEDIFEGVIENEN